MSLRVVQVVDTLHLGGTESQCVALCRGLAARGVPTRLVHFRVGPLRDQLDVDGITVDRLEFGGFLRPGFPRLVRRLARDLRAWRADVVQGWDFYSNLPAVLAGRLAGVPVRIASKRGHGLDRSRAHLALERFTRRLADTTVVNSAELRARLAGEDARVRVAVIPNCVVARGPIVPPHDPIVGMVANLRSPKDPLTFLRAAALVAERVPTATFHLVGAGPMEQEARDLADELGLGPRVHFFGRLDPDAVWTALNRFAVSVLSSLSEGMPNAVLESMAAARPVVATAVGGVREVVEDGVTGFLVPPRDASALAAPIARLLKDPGAAAEMGARARRHVLAAHGVDRMVDDFIALWTSLGARGRA